MPFTQKYASKQVSQYVLKNPGAMSDKGAGCQKKRQVSFHYSLFAFLSIMPDPRDFLIVQANEACKSTISRLAKMKLSLHHFVGA
jgi:hypothetical protein